MADGAGTAAPQADAQMRTTAAARAWRVALFSTVVLLAACGGAALLIAPSPWYPDSLVFLTLFCAQQQDIPVGAAICVLLLVMAAATGLVPAARKVTLRPAAMVAVAAALVAAIWLVRTGILFDHDLTRDEHMAVFDARIFGSGRLFWPLHPAFKPYYSALNDLFLFPIGDREGWVSSYLPVNAALRGYLAHVMPLSLVSPLLVGIGGLALWRIAVRFWPDDGATQAVVLACYAASSQVVLTGTAAFAMSTHLAFNLVWLALFLRGTRAGHAGALLTGFLATGIHQPLFHPLFVLPFLDLLRRQRRWRTLALYIASYLAIGLTWAAWPHWLAAHGVGITPGTPAGGFGFLARLAAVLTPPNLAAVLIMAGNLLRFVVWQHPLAVPLALVAIRFRGGSDDQVRALALGLAITFLAMAILLPPQGHGWGYRYLHGLIGNLCLLAGFGWRWLGANGGVPRRAMQVATLVALVVILPLHTVMVRGMIEPYARAAAAFARLDADYVIVDSETLPFGTNFVINRPDLANRPRLLLGSLLYPYDLARLCPDHRTVAFADAPAFAATYRYYQDPVPTRASRLQRLQRAVAARAGCRVITAPVE